MSNLGSGQVALLIRVFYLVGLSIGFTLHTAPLAGMIETLRKEDEHFSKDTLKIESRLRSFSVRTALALLVAAVGHQARNFA